MSDEIEFKDSHGADWCKYTCSYIDHEGKQYCMDLWAMNDEDADLRAAAVRKSFQIDGRLAMVIDADGGEVLAESSVPVNESGVTH